MAGRVQPDCETVVLGTSQARDASSALPPWPVIGLGAWDADGADRVDVVAPDDAAHERLVAAIVRHPQPARVLVQVLRETPGMDPLQALTVESLAFATLQSGGDHARWLAARPSPSIPGDHGERVLMDRDGDHLDITLDRPARHNAIDRAMRDALNAAFDLVAIDRSITSVAVRGKGACFSTGGDLTEFGTTRDPATAHDIRGRTLPARRLIGRSACVTFHLHGACVGAGIELAAFGDRIVAAPDTWFQLPELTMGLIPGAGGCVSIPRRIGRQRTAFMALTGRRIGAATALDWGLIDALSIAPSV